MSTIHFAPPDSIRDLFGSLARETRALIVRLFAYGCMLAVLAFAATDLFERNQDLFAQAGTMLALDAPANDWVVAPRMAPGFTLSLPDFRDKTESYTVLKHRLGGRKDRLAWAAESGTDPVAEIEIERYGLIGTGDGAENWLASRLSAMGSAIETAGRIDTKFGPVALWRTAGSASQCLGFSRNFQTPTLSIRGWSCAAPTVALQQIVVRCALDRLMLLNAGSDSLMTQLFARAELNRRDCTDTSPARDWISAADGPRLRGRI